MLSIVLCFIVILGATIVNVLVSHAVIKRLKLVEELNRINREKLEMSVQQRKQICDYICRFKHYREDLESLEWQCEACPLNTMS